MKANTVFIHREHARAALQTATDEFFTIQTRHRGDLGLADEVTGDLLMNKVKWFFNVTRGTLIRVDVLGRYSTLNAAIGATSGRKA